VAPQFPTWGAVLKVSDQGKVLQVMHWPAGICVVHLRFIGFSASATLYAVQYDVHVQTAEKLVLYTLVELSLAVPLHTASLCAAVAG
jgi:hypothetical protein